eukprot:7244235-Lingulodinium_polyedra.AAC.1
MPTERRAAEAQPAWLTRKAFQQPSLLRPSLSAASLLEGIRSAQQAPLEEVVAAAVRGVGGDCRRCGVQGTPGH